MSDEREGREGAKTEAQKPGRDAADDKAAAKAEQERAEQAEQDRVNQTRQGAKVRWNHAVAKLGDQRSRIDKLVGSGAIDAATTNGFAQAFERFADELAQTIGKVTK